MAHRTGVALHHAVRDGAITGNEAVRRNGCMAAGVGAGAVELETMRAVAAPHPRSGVEGMKASTAKAAGMKATTSMESAATMEAPSTMETAAMETAAATTTTMESTTAAATVETTATAVGRLGEVREWQPSNSAHEDHGERQRNPFAASRSQDVFPPP